MIKMNLKPSKNKVPRHIGYIIDGNRRFARRLMLKPYKGHEWGAKKVEKLLNWCKEYGIKELTLYAFSLENFDRPKKEFNYLMNLFKEEFTRLKDHPDLKDTRIRFIGRIWMFPKDIQDIMNELAEETKNHDKFTVNFAMAYSGRAEILDATRRIANLIENGKITSREINDKLFSENLYLNSEPDLIIRTSESRLSGFLLWQGAYAEIEFLPNKLWPEFSKKDFVKCLNEYSKRDRRFGK
ncbi:MAG: Tritrans,polycis-undecaprenyl-diphosphate synthase, geranylgeranyl-diphosphate specific [archaeon GW2011_AR20]|nr:MAG: Tritrans,polycis-undecaprenyl-diphosphate synthase, geranylgeranyl-diphosphate specific [archaeon GW2011_AR20]MBS3161046.1 di-trans,poly-cis-decaprenylcistransferase [Candidatus Woesearchaeota archaeon]